MCVVKNSLKKYTIKNWSGNQLFTLSSSDDSTAILRVQIWENEKKKKQQDIQGRENKSDLWEKMGSSFVRLLLDRTQSQGLVKLPRGLGNGIF